MYKLTEVESRTQGSRPRTQKKSEAKAKDSLSEDKPLKAKDRNARAQGPRTQAQVFSKKKRSSKIFFRRSPFIGVPRIFDWSKPSTKIVGGTRPPIEI